MSPGTADAEACGGRRDSKRAPDHDRPNTRSPAATRARTWSASTDRAQPARADVGARRAHAAEELLHGGGDRTAIRHEVAVVGAGPAGLACAHGLAREGHSVVIFVAPPKAGGLNEYGIASYKTTGGFAQKEVEWLLSIGGIELRLDQQLGRDITLDGLRADFDAVFLGLGLGGVNALDIAEPDVAGLGAAVDFIAELRQASDLAQLPVGRDVIVIGGGMTAVDAAVQSKLLGATTATIVYRRGSEAMSASTHEQDWAQHNGVTIRHWAAPQAVLSEGGRLIGVG